VIFSIKRETELELDPIWSFKRSQYLDVQKQFFRRYLIKFD